MAICEPRDVVTALAAVLPYAITRAEEMAETAQRPGCAYAARAAASVAFAAAVLGIDEGADIDALRRNLDAARAACAPLTPEQCGRDCGCLRAGKN